MKKSIPQTNIKQEIRTATKAEKNSKRYKLIRNCIFISGLSVFAQLYLFQPMLSNLCTEFGIMPAMSSLAVSVSTLGMATGLFIFAFMADSFSREKLMGFTLIVSSLLTVLSAFAWSFPSLLVLSFLKGIVLSGVSAVALSYLTEEVSTAVIGLSISLYLSGNTIGGMTGRVSAILVSGWTDWRWAAVTLGIVSLLLGVLFVRNIPKSQNYIPQQTNIKQKIGRMKQLLRTPLFIGIYFVGGLLMGSFVSVYNYLSFILESPRFGLPHYLVAMIFMMYITGVAGSIVTGKLSDKHNPGMLLKSSIILMLLGLLLMMIMELWSIIVGLGIMTFSFFSAHTMASRIISLNAGEAKSSATCLYWLFYYSVSSIAGWITGVILDAYGWNIFITVLFGLTVIALILSGIVSKKPYGHLLKLPQNVSMP